MCKCIKTSFSKVFNEVKYHPVIIIVNLLMFLVGGILSWQIWVHGGGRTTFGPLNSYFFLGFSLIIATAAAVNSAIAATIASRSLRTTRATQRPFLSVEDSVTCFIYPKSIGRIIASINNKENFPADEVSASCEVRRIKRNAVDNYSLPFQNEKAYYSSHCFPGDGIQYFFEKEGIEMESADKLEVYITIKYSNKLTEEKHKTIRAYSMIFTPTDTNEILPPYPQGDYWD